MKMTAKHLRSILPPIALLAGRPSTTSPVTAELDARRGKLPRSGGSHGWGSDVLESDTADLDQLDPSDVGLCQFHSDPVTQLPSPQVQFREGTEGSGDWLRDNNPA